MEKSWVWQLNYKGDKTYLVLCDTPTRYEALSGVVGWLYNRCIPGTFGICNRLIWWLDKQVTPRYEIEITKDILRNLVDDCEEDDGEEQTKEGS